MKTLLVFASLNALLGCLEIDPLPPLTPADAGGGRDRGHDSGDAGMPGDAGMIDRGIIDGGTPRDAGAMCADPSDCLEPDDPCLRARCEGGRCTTSIEAGAECDDGDACNGPDRCSAQGDCVPEGRPDCSPEQCDPSTRMCLDGPQCGPERACPPDRVCVAGACQPACNDNSCASNERCIDGECRALQLMQLRCMGGGGHAEMRCGDEAVSASCERNSPVLGLRCALAEVEVCCSSGEDCDRGGPAGSELPTVDRVWVHDGEFERLPAECQSGSAPGVVRCTVPVDAMYRLIICDSRAGGDPEPEAPEPDAPPE